MASNYSHEEHLHRFACWTAARAAQRGWSGGTTAVITAALELSGFREKLAEIYQSSPTAAEFDEWHAERVGELTLAMIDKLSKPQQNIYGRVAKIIAIYIKTVYVSQDPDAALSKVAHPPIDGILLKGVKKNTHLKYPPKLGFHWSTFDAEAYRKALNCLREVNQGKAFWEISYFLEFGSIPTANSWRFPYAHFVSVTPSEPIVARFSSDAVQGCAPLSIAYTNEATGSPTSFSWTFPGGTPASSNLPNPSVTYASSGIYPATLIVSNETSSDTLTREAYVEVLTTATPAFTHDAPNSRTVNFENETQFSGETPGYRWDFGDGQISTELSPVHIFPANEIYEVTLTAENQCGATSTTQIINLTTVASSDPINELAITLSPNPATDVLTLQLSGDFSGPVSATIVNQLGQPITTRSLSKNSHTSSFTFDVDQLTPGTYHLMLTAATLSRTVQFVRQ